MTNPPLTAANFLARSIEQEQERFTQEANRLVEQAAHIAATPPSSQRKVSGDITRLIQEASFLLKRAATIEAGAEALGLMGVEDTTTEQPGPRP
jgi:hypothetical protein